MAKTKGKSAATAPKATESGSSKPKSKVKPEKQSAPVPPVASPDVEPSTAGESYKYRSVTKSARAGLTFPVNRVRKQLQKGKYADKIGVGAAVYLTSVLEYLTLELIEVCGEASAANKRKRITPRHIMLAVHSDEEFTQLLKDVTIASSGVPVKIHDVLLPAATRAKQNKVPVSAPAPEPEPVNGGGPDGSRDVEENSDDDGSTDDSVEEDGDVSEEEDSEEEEEGGESQDY